MNLRQKRIFVVEDNLEKRIVYQLIFSREGAVVEFERWGPDAVAKLKRMQRVDLIILDLMLARSSSGYTIFDEIRMHHEFDDVPIVAVSSSDPSEAIPKTRGHGFSGYISKPIDQARFPQQLCKIIEGDAVWEDS